MKVESIHRMKQLIERKREIESELKLLNKEISRLEEFAMKEFIDNGVDSIKVDGATMYLHRQLWAGVNEGFTKEQAAQELKEVGLGEYVQESFNMNSLSAYYREATRESDDIQVPRSIKLEERFSLRMRRS